MTNIIRSFSWVLAGVFLCAGVAKLARPGPTRASFVALGIHQAPILAGGLPAVEILAAAVLVVWPRWGAVGAGVLLVVFSIALVRAMRSGLRVPCNCFGATSSDPVSWLEILRNAALVLIAAVVVAANPERGVHLDGTLVALGLALVFGMTMALLRVKHTIGSVWAVHAASAPGAL